MKFLVLLFAASAAALSASPAAAQSVYPDYLYHPVPPCRVFFTVSTGRIAANETRSFQVSGDAGFSEQGGKAGGCGVPAYAAMVSLSLTASRTETVGFVAASSATDEPKVRLASYAKSATATGSANVMLRQGKAAVFSSAAAHVEGVVTGYFAPQIWATVRAEGYLYMTTGRFKSARRLSVGVYEVTADREIHRCGAVASAALQNYYATASTDLPPKSFVTVKVFDPSGQPADAPFTVQVAC